MEPLETQSKGDAMKSIQRALLEDIKNERRFQWGREHSMAADATSKVNGGWTNLYSC